MKNIHVLPADKEPVKGDLLLRHLWKGTSNECISWWRYNYTITIDGVTQYTTLNGSFRDITSSFKTQNIYITSDEEIKEGDWVIYTNGIVHCQKMDYKEDLSNVEEFNAKKIILTTDQDLINDGVQAIDDEFLEWFVKNPSCEEVEVTYGVLKPFQSADKGYLIHCPDNEVLEEPKQNKIDFMANELIIEKERMYSEEDMEKYSDYCWNLSNDNRYKSPLSPKEWFEQFKNK